MCSKLIKIGGMVLIIVLVIVFAMSCGEGGGNGGGEVSEMAESAGKDVRTAATSAREAASKGEAQGSSQFEALLDEHADKISSLKAKAKSLADDKLNALIKQLDAKLATARDELAKLMSSDQGSMMAVKDKIQPLIDEIEELYNQALEMISK